MKVRRLGVCLVAALGFLIASGSANAQTPSQYQILDTLYGSYVGAPPTAGASFWSNFQVSNSSFNNTLNNSASVTLTSEVAFSKAGDQVIGTGPSSPTATNSTSYGAVTGNSTWNGVAGDAFNNKNMNTFSYSANTFSKVSGGGPSFNPPVPNGSFTFEPSAGASAFTVNVLPAGTVKNGTVMSQSQIGSDTIEFASSTNNADMVAYRIVIGGNVNYVLMWNLSGNGSLSSGNYTDLVLNASIQNPEPASLALMGFGAVGLIGYRLRRRRIQPNEVVAVS
jgi:hypothetical protein